MDCEGNRMFEKYSRTLPGRLVALTLALFLILTSGAQRAQAQQTSGAVSGTVVDAKNHGLSGVQVEFIRQDTGLRSTALTDEHGFYRFPAVDPGIYTIAFSKKEFQTSPLESFVVNSSLEKTINRTLQLASAETVNVIEPAGEE